MCQKLCRCHLLERCSVLLTAQVYSLSKCSLFVYNKSLGLLLCICGTIVMSHGQDTKYHYCPWKTGTCDHPSLCFSFMFIHTNVNTGEQKWQQMHVFAAQQSVCLNIFEYIILFSHLFDSVLFVYFQDLYENRMIFWVRNIENSKGFTNFQAVLSLSLYIYIERDFIYIYIYI